MKLRFRSFGVVALLVALGCGTAGAPVEIASGKPLPASSAQALSLKTSGAAWSNAEIRAHYLALAAAIGPADAELKRRGVPAEERAHRAFQTRHDARVTCRAMMADAREVTALNHRSRFSNNTHASLEPRAPASGPVQSDADASPRRSGEGRHGGDSAPAPLWVRLLARAARVRLLARAVPMVGCSR